MDEQLRLSTEMTDKASPVLRGLRKTLESIQRTPGMDAAAKWSDEFGTKANNLMQQAGGLASVIERMGVSGLGAAGSLAGLATQFTALSTHVLTLREMARETGLTIDQLNAFEKAGAKFGVSTGSMQSAIEHLQAQMPQFRNGMGELFNELKERAPDLTKALKLENTRQQIDEIFRYLGQKKLQDNPQQQKQIADLFFGNGAQLEALFQKGGGGFTDELRRLEQSLPPITEEMQKQAEAFRNSVNSLNNALEKFELGVGPQFLEQMAGIVSGAEKVFNFLQKTPGQALADAKNGLSGVHVDKNSVAGVFKDGVDAVMRLFGGGPSNEAKPPPGAGLGIGLRHKTSFEGGTSDLNSLFHKKDGGLTPASFNPAALVRSGLDNPMASAVKEGTLAAFREWAQQSDALSKAGDSGFQNASFGGFGGGGGGFGGGGGGGFGGGARAARHGGGASDAGPTPDGIATAAQGLPKEARALLDDIGSGEAKGYNIVNGGGRFGSYAGHPYGGLSTYRGGRAAGRYQDLPSTWARIARATGLKDFSPESQDKGNWWLAQQDYRARSGRDLLSDLRSNNPARIAQIGRYLHPTWISTNGSFAAKYQHYLQRHGQDAPTGFAGRSPPLPPVPMPANMPPPIPPIITQYGGKAPPSLSPGQQGGAQDAGASNHQLDIHIHDPGRKIRMSRLQSDGGMKVSLRTMPTMTTPDQLS